MKHGQWATLCGAVLLFLLVLAAGEAGFAGTESPSSIKACEIVSGEEVAGMAGAKLLVNPLPTAMVCNYVVELAGGAAENYSLAFDEAATAELMLQYLDAEEKGTKIAGILDEAYLGREVMGSRFTLRALKKGKIGMTVTGERKEVVLKIAHLAITRLP